MLSTVEEMRAYFKTHYLPDGSLSHGLQVYLNLLKSKEHQPKNTKEYALFANNVVDQIIRDYTKPAHWPTVVRFMHKTNRPDVNNFFLPYRVALWDSLTPDELKEGKRIMKKYPGKEPTSPKK